MSSAVLDDPRARVGRPIHETRLVDALVPCLGAVFAPGAGRSVYLLREPELGRGRPDLIALLASPTGVAAYRRRGLRLPHLTAAFAVDGATDDGALGVSRDYARKVRRHLTATGWNSQALHSAELVYDSLAIEAKMDDWRRAVRQASKFQSLSHRSALLLPDAVAQRTDSKMLKFYEIGLLGVAGTNVCWRRTAPKRMPEIGARLWLLELLVRGLEAGSAYKLSL